MWCDSNEFLSYSPRNKCNTRNNQVPYWDFCSTLKVSHLIWIGIHALHSIIQFMLSHSQHVLCTCGNTNKQNIWHKFKKSYSKHSTVILQLTQLTILTSHEFHSHWNCSIMFSRVDTDHRGQYPCISECIFNLTIFIWVRLKFLEEKTESNFETVLHYHTRNTQLLTMTCPSSSRTHWSLLSSTYRYDTVNLVTHSSRVACPWVTTLLMCIAVLKYRERAGLESSSPDVQPPPLSEIENSYWNFNKVTTWPNLTVSPVNRESNIEVPLTILRGVQSSLVRLIPFLSRCAGELLIKDVMFPRQKTVIFLTYTCMWKRNTFLKGNLRGTWDTSIDLMTGLKFVSLPFLVHQITPYKWKN